MGWTNFIKTAGKGATRFLEGTGKGVGTAAKGIGEGMGATAKGLGGWKGVVGTGAVVTAVNSDHGLTGVLSVRLPMPSLNRYRISVSHPMHRLPLHMLICSRCPYSRTASAVS